jgi:hypothetical protein
MITENQIDELLILYKIKCNECEHYKKQASIYSDLLKIKDETIEILKNEIDLKKFSEKQLSEL